MAAMTHQSQADYLCREGDAGARVAQLRNVLTLVAELAGRETAANGDSSLDESARVSASYDRASPLVQRRFDVAAAEAAGSAAAGVEALLARNAAGAAAAVLANEIEASLHRLRRIVA
jgi:hypothetical protein